MASFSHQQQQQRAVSPHRTMVWTEPKKPKKVAVVYYLCREDGQLEHPHFMEVTTSGSGGRLCLRDFTERLDTLRGKGMAAMYSWSSKRSYRNNGFVWHDLTEDDIIHPATANEYVLKGSHRLSSIIRNNHPRGSSSCDHHHEQQQQAVVSLRQGTDDEISPPPSSSSPSSGDTLHQQTLVTSGGGRIMRASSLLMQLISCGTAAIKSHSSLSRPEEEEEEENKKTYQKPTSSEAAGRDEDPRDYFSGSLVESNNRKKKTNSTAALKRSSSCNYAGTDRRPLEGRATGSLRKRTPAGALDDQ